MSYRHVWAEIDLKALQHNYNLIRGRLKPNTKLLIPVKAHGYGHGLIPVSRTLERLGVDYLGVASIDEGVVLRQAGIKKPILILGSILPQDAGPLLEFDLAQTICNLDVALVLNARAVRQNKKAVVHIKVDTGMHRLGVPVSQAQDFIKDIMRLKNLIVEGIYTHFPCADSNPEFTGMQISAFNILIFALREIGIEVPLRHAANSIGVIDYPDSHFNLVRPGIMIYGLSPGKGLCASTLGLKPLLCLKSKIINIMEVEEGKGISYGHQYVTTRKSRIATLSAGYGDGYPRCLSDKASCIISGKKAKLVGTICMDQMMADVTDLGDIKIGQDAVLIGRDGNEEITVEELADLAGTIPYEIVCGLGTRIEWRYLR